MVSLYGWIKKHKHNIRVLKEAKRPSGALSSDEKWFWENRKRLLGICRDVKTNLSDIKSITRREKSGRMFSVCQSIIEESTYSFDQSELIEHLKTLQEKSEYFKISELLSLRTVFICLSIDKIAKAIENGTLYAGKTNGLVGLSIELIYNLYDIDFDEVLASVSRTEALLRDDPGGVYGISDSATKSMYRRKLAEICKQSGVDEYKTVSKYSFLASDSEGKRGSISYYIMKDSECRCGWMYFAALCVIPSVIVLLLIYLSFAIGNTALILSSVLAYFPLRALIKAAINDAIAKNTTADTLPRIKFDAIPDAGKTLVVYTCVLSDADKDKRLFDKIECYARAYNDKNLKFAVLADLPDAAKESLDSDCEIIGYAKKRIDGINKHGNIAALFWRERTYSQSERKYMGRERKRGAQEELVSLIKGARSALRSYADIDITSFKYILALDSDTEIMFHDIKKLIGTALHPYNECEYRSGVGGVSVSSGYGIIQPTALLSLKDIDKRNEYSIYKNAFDGRNSYESASFSMYHKLFGIGCYCGKGLISVDAYHRVIKGAFPKESVLSHDIPEGLRLRCGNASDIAIYDSPPTSYLSERKRRHRWMRGDVQSLVLSKRYIRDENGDKYKNPLSALEKLILFEPVRDIILSAVRIPGVILSMTAGVPLGGLIFLTLVSDNVYSSAKRIAGSIGIPKRKYLSGFPDYYDAVCFSAAFELFSAADDFALSSDALIRSYYRVHISHRKLLEWAVFDPDSKQNNDTAIKYCKKLKTSVVIGVLSIIASASTFGIYQAILIFNGLLWCAFPIWMHRMNKRVKTHVNIPPTSAESLRHDAMCMWAFFSKYVTEEYNHLPPDNVSFMPEQKTAERTSPTNIGMYLISTLNAFDFGFIDSAELYRRLSDTIETIESLDKWNGHLYNWYDIKTLAVLYPSYVSTVDSGNLTASLITVKNGIAGLGVLFLKLIKRIDAIIENTDFRVLYNARRDLFYIGYNGMKNEYDRNVYDLYASEMLTTSFYAVASGQVPSAHFSSLGRLFSDRGGISAMLSWSGSTFEYFMPSIFLPMQYKTERGEMLLSAHHAQKSKSADFHGIRLYGISESAFYDFDDGRNYSYKAHGVKELALSPDSDKDDVFAPYSLYLMSRFDPEIVYLINNLQDTELCGKYGLYDAVDLTQHRVGNEYGIARLYMSHHMGMSIASIANLCFDNINVKRFMSTPSAEAASPLLYSKNEICRHAADENYKMNYSVHPRRFFIEGLISKSGTAVISNGRERIIASDDGEITLFSGRKLLTQPPSRSVGGVHVFMKIDNEVYDCTSGHDNARGIKSSFYYDGAQILYTNEIIHEERLITSKLTLCVDPGKAIFDMRLNVEGIDGMIEVLYFILPVMDGEDHYKSSPSYSDLFISVETKQSGGVLYKRRVGSGEDIGLHVSTIGKTPRATFTRVDEALHVGYGKKDIMSLFKKQSSGVSGPCVHPLYAAVLTGGSGDNAVFEIELSLDSEISAKSHDEIYQSAKKHFALTSSLAGADGSAVKTASDIVTALYKTGGVTEFFEYADIKYRRDIFWRYGISGDLPMLTVFVGETEKSSTEFVIEELLRAKRFLFISGVRFDMIFIADDGGYMASGVGFIKRLADKNSCGGLISKDNGIFIIGKETLSDNDEKVFVAASSGIYNIGAECGFSFNKQQVKRKVRVSQPKKLPLNNFIPRYDDIKIENGASPSPWCMVYANPTFGTLLHNTSSGFSWYRNSSLSTVSARHRDPVVSDAGETLEVITSGGTYDLLSNASQTLYLDGCAVYRGEINGLDYEASVGVDAKLPSKLYHVSFSDDAEEASRKVILTVYPPTGAVLCKDMIIPLSENGLSLSLFGISDTLTDEIATDGAGISVSANAEKGKCAFVFSAFPSSSRNSFVPYVKNKFRIPDSVTHAFSRYADEKCEFLQNVEYSGANKWVRPMLRYSSYQALWFRMFAKCGYSQPGGAYGFRDQLQDSLSALYYKPELTKYQILRSCCHQYTNGRVQHWWHTGVGGLKSRCSDDYMWLPFVTAEYVTATNDCGILSLKIPFLSSPHLSDGEEDRYEKAEHSKEKYTVFEHCMQAIRASRERGAHGLPPMLSGDWNDGMNEIGKKGFGESVWLAFFFAVTYRKFAEIIKEYDGEKAELCQELYRLADELVASAETAWDGGWYLRAYDDEGNKVGSIESNECKIDTIPQAFSVFANADPERRVFAMESVYRELYDEEYGILRLFAPSFSQKRDYGYICRYPAGIRENGGQYTHAAIWAATAYFELGAHSRGMEILKALTPLDIYARGAMNGQYTAEPYLICADIYHGENITGKSGWSGYTGSASWYYRTVMKYVLGIEPYRGNIKLTPPPEAVNGNYSASVCYNGCRISFSVIYDDREIMESHDEKYDRVVSLTIGGAIIIDTNGENLKILIKVKK